ncbi:MAG: 16S rRNA (guanine(527)-N(7))-methyltransferase RsmG [Proteobacteria bacterium]|nr:16S rRNA (guanine(527)-N(7))-methyltransferase RsmG [Pseudomonadota bacterium]
MRKTVQIQRKIEKEFPTLNLSREKTEKIARYLEILDQWNRKINLTAIRDFDLMIIKHILDSLIVFRLPSVTDSQKYLSGNVLDIGSGAGIPGIVLSICHPTLKVVSVDKSQKKIGFQEYVKAQLGLKNLHPVADRLEDLARLPEHQEAFDCIVSRAFDQIKELFKLSIVFLNETGSLVLWKGEKWRKELNNVPPDLKRHFEVREAIKYSFSEYNHGGTLLAIRKIQANTPSEEYIAREFK